MVPTSSQTPQQRKVPRLLSSPGTKTTYRRPPYISRCIDLPPEVAEQNQDIIISVPTSFNRECYALPMKQAAIVVVAALALIGVMIYAPTRTEAPEVERPLVAPTFTWSYEETTVDGIPYTQISLTAIPEEGGSRSAVIDRVEGSCNAHDGTETDLYERSTMVICYYAGLGRYYKVVQSGEEYLVQRRVFEEASPDYDPPVEPFETVARF
jgi:hypothetical protein